MNLKDFFLKNILLISLSGLLAGYSAFLLGSIMYSHSVKIHKQSQWYKKERITKALELVGETSLLAEVDMVIQSETNVEFLICQEHSCPNMYLFSKQFCAVAKWTSCQMPHYDKAIALMRPFRKIDPSDAICFLPSNVVWESSTVLVGSTWITDRIFLISNLRLTGCDSNDMDTIILPATEVHRDEFAGEDLY